MKANSTHISIETAKLLKDCGVRASNHFSGFYGFYEKGSPDKSFGELPAYTWQEILWEHAGEFFGKEIKNFVNDSYEWGMWEGCAYHSFQILALLQQKKYNEADEYFRKNCILIKK